MSRGNNKFNPWMNRNFQQNKQRPMYSMSANQNNQNNPNGNSSGSLGSDVYVAEQEPGAFIGWKLYFPNKGKFVILLSFNSQHQILFSVQRLA